jgi:hypothetical protein
MAAICARGLMRHSWRGPPVQQSRTDAGNENRPTHHKESNNPATIILDMRHMARYGSGR